MKFRLKIVRTRIDVGYVAVEAESEDEALRKYWEPDFSNGEDFIFDDEIDWDVLDCDEYDVEVCGREEDV